MTHDDLKNIVDAETLEDLYKELQENLQDVFLSAPVFHSAKVHCDYSTDVKQLLVIYNTPSEEQWLRLNAPQVRVASRLFNLHGDVLEDCELV